MLSEDAIAHPIQQRWRVEADYFHRQINNQTLAPTHQVRYKDDIHEYYLNMAVQLLTPLYSCNRPPGAAGAILVTPDWVIFGHVAPANLHDPSCKDAGCEMEDGHCVRTIHAERRCLLYAARAGIAMQPGGEPKSNIVRLYSILKPCYECSKEIVVAGVSEIYYAGAAYDAPSTRSVLLSAGIKCEYIDIGIDYGLTAKQSKQ